jgi:N-acetylglucosaminyl-diphospho-decaprenol L-rhamnosyltransferase
MTARTMAVDVVIVSYQSGAAMTQVLPLATCLAAGGRVVVVNNDPSDHVAREAAREAGATLISNAENVGFAAAVNQGVAATVADILLLLNPDVARVEGEIAGVLELFHRDPTVAAVGVRLLNVDGSVQPSCRAEPGIVDFVSETLALWQRLPSWRRGRAFRMLDWGYDEQAVVDCASGACLFVRRAVFDDLGGLDERFFVYSEELDMLVRAKRAGWKTLFTPAVTAVHTGGGSSESPRDYLSLLLLASWYQYAAKHFGRGRTLTMRAVLCSIDLLRLGAALLLRRSTTPPAALRARVAIHVGVQSWPHARLARVLGQRS